MEVKKELKSRPLGTMKNRPIPLALSSPHSLLALAMGGHAGFFYSTYNVDDLTPLIFAANVVLIATFNLIVVNIFIVLLNNLNKTKIDSRKILMGVMFMLFAHYMGILFFGNKSIHQYFTAPTSRLVPNLPALIFFSVAFLGGWMMGNRVHKMILFVGLLTIVPFYRFGANLALKWTAPKEIITYPYGISDEALGQFTFQKKDNIYFILLDSYTSIEGLEILGLNNTRFLNGIKKKGFNLYRSFFTNFQTTRNAMPTYLNMSLKNDGKLFYDVPWSIRSKIIAGEGQVYKILEHNNYKISMLYPNRYLLGNLPCQVAYCSPPISFMRYANLFIRIIFRTFYKENNTVPVQGDFVRVFNEIREHKNQRYFSYLHFYLPNHVYEFHYGICDQEQETKAYPRRMERANRLTIELLDSIIKTDPKAMIILASDHGPTLFNKCAMDVPLKTREEIIERQGAFLAIKWNGEYDGRFDSRVKTSANLFRYIFAHLTGDDSILDNPPPDNAYYKVGEGEIRQSIDNGTLILDRPR